jgi:hypothetical protein
LFFFYQVWHILFSNTLKKKSEENFHVWFKFITLDKIKLGNTIIIYVIYVC